MAEALSYCAAEVRRADYDRYLTALFAPAAAYRSTQGATIRYWVKQPTPDLRIERSQQAWAVSGRVPTIGVIRGWPAWAPCRRGSR